MIITGISPTVDICVWMDNKQMEMCSISLIFREIQIKTMMRYYYISTVVIKKILLSIHNDMESLEPSFISGGEIKYYNTLEDNLTVTLKVKYIKWPSNSTA